MKQIIAMVLCLISLVGMAQKKKKQDVESILDMCGCYDISFNFAETFGADKEYEYHKNYYSGGLEWVFPVINEKDKIVLQHLLVIGDTMIIKHWRQDWLFENQDLYVYDKNNTFEKNCNKELVDFDPLDSDDLKELRRWQVTKKRELLNI